MALSLETSSPSLLSKEFSISMTSSPPLFSPCSEKRFWSALRSRVDTLLDNRRKFHGKDLPISGLGAETGSGKGKEDSLLLLRGFDSISSSLSQLTSNIDTALQGARDLGKSSLSESLHNNLENSKCNREGTEGGEQKVAEEENNRGQKRKMDSNEFSDDQGDAENKEEVQNLKSGKLKKAKILAVSVATKAASLARELKSIKSDLCFMQDRCALLEEENRRLREGYGNGKGMRHEEDDLVRLQLEALLTEKSRLAHENANLTRENQCLNELVEYHHLTSQDLSASYEQAIRGMCLDFDGLSPPPPLLEEEEADSEDGAHGYYMGAPGTPRTDLFSFSTALDECTEEQHNHQQI